MANCQPTAVTSRRVALSLTVTHRRFSTRRVLPVLCALSLAVAACHDRLTSGPGLPFTAALALAPGVESVVGGPVFELSGVRVSLSEPGGRTVVFDTVASFSAGDS